MFVGGQNKSNLESTIVKERKLGLIIVAAIAAGVAMMANGNEDSPLLWGVLTFVLGIVGAFGLGLLGYGMIGGLVGSGVGAGIYVTKMVRYG
jgi:hypothetical protein